VLKFATQFRARQQSAHWLANGVPAADFTRVGVREAGLVLLQFRKPQSKSLFPLVELKRRAGTMHFRPLGDRVLVRRVEEEERTKGGIIVPDTAKEKPQEGEVIALGPGTRDDTGKLTPLDVKVGDRILFGKWSGTEVKIDGEDFTIMKESDILGVVERISAGARKAA
jgi:chaperonin GroES